MNLPIFDLGNKIKGDDDLRKNYHINLIYHMHIALKLAFLGPDVSFRCISWRIYAYMRNTLHRLIPLEMCKH